MKKSASIIPILTEAERTLVAAVKHFKLTVKPENICLTVQSAGRKQAVGWFWAGSWQHGKQANHEINMSAECLQSHNMGELILHELAHAENQALGIRDCAARVHNKKFKTMAERLGLLVKPRDKSVGFGFTDLAAPGKAFLSSIKFNQALFDAHRGAAGSKKKVGSRLIKCQCDACGYVARTTQKWLDESGAPLCPCNNEPMEVA